MGEVYGICLQPSLRMLFRQTFYEVKFYVDFRGCVCGLSFQSNIWIDYTCCVYGLSFWDRLTGRVCDPSFQTEFTDQVYECSLLLIFFGLTLQIQFIGQIYK